MDPDPFPRPFRSVISKLGQQARPPSAWPSYESAVAAPLPPADAQETPKPVLDDRIFPCTFCHSTFKTKHDWQRHERSLHLSLEEWTCNTGDGLATSPVTGKPHCAYCDEAEPTPQHLDAHHHQACSSSSNPPRTFRRKDHLVQHLRLVHHVDKEKLPSLDADRWCTNAAPAAASRCGFCGCQLQGWQTRADHLAVHFRSGFTMQDWHGDYGFSPSVAAQVRNAMR
ncbi:hypothetical protein ASPVEDRAFT_152691 [Aspergillus versicolor CBS 583.65]|uniref:C2H2-type domain-containing protein n=1 Tax=Aspergillus versicolor CBS 583.65 TaxID=1036611 RepID=A0A1L9PS90_ASPVE|nr:uncharacterized protein ASPVEDRAFT_152691 [Aspergillus versicolor CBS 583.65]OJJ04316.1 hypothetical protein ASPVEDRAFT_152691 [Aspergillus versicolor CBS 583.65]